MASAKCYYMFIGIVSLCFGVAYICLEQKHTTILDQLAIIPQIIWGGQSLQGNNIPVKVLPRGEIAVSVLKSSSWTLPNIPKEVFAMNQDNPELASYILKNWLLPPSKEKYRLENPKTIHYSQEGQSQIVDELLKQRTGGFFIEAGAFSGEWLSNSLFFLKSRNWTGLLVEVNQGDFRSIINKKRHAYTLNAGLCPIYHPKVLTFSVSGVISGFSDFMEERHKKRITNDGKRKVHNIQVPCFPLFAVLNALNVNHVDYFSLDTEGSEIDILKTLPLDKIVIDVITIEYVVGGANTQDYVKSAEKVQRLVEYLGPYGYKLIRVNKMDVIFIKEY